MFVLGVLVGRGTAPVHFDLDLLQKQLAGVKENVTAEEAQRFEVNLEKLNFFKKLKEADRDTPASSDPDTSRKAADAVPHKTVLVKKPAEADAAPATAEAAAAEASEGELVIQVASSKDAEATRYLVDRLKKKGYAAFSTLIEVPEKGTWHRIRVGPFADRNAADEVLARLKTENYNAYIVRR